MKLNAAQDLQAQVRTIAERLSRDFATLLEDQLERGAPGAGRDLAQRALERFWTTALDSTGLFFDRSSVRFPAGFFGQLHRQWVEALRPLARPCFAPILGELRNSFAEIVLYDEAGVDEIAERLRLKAVAPSGRTPSPLGEPFSPPVRLRMSTPFAEIPPAVPAGTGRLPAGGEGHLGGRLGALYDVLRGFVVRLWFDSGSEADSGPPLRILSSLKPGSLLLGGARLVAPRTFERLAQAGAHGAFRAGRLSAFRFLARREGCRRNGIRIEDGEIELSGEGSVCRLRRVAVVGKDRIHAVVTNVLDSSVLPARLAIQLAVPQWRIERTLSDVGGVVDLKRFNATNPHALESQFHAAAILGAALRAAQGWIAEASGLPPGALSPEFLFPQLARWMSSSLFDQGQSEESAESGKSRPGRRPVIGAKVITGDDGEDTISPGVIAGGAFNPRSAPAEGNGLLGPNSYGPISLPGEEILPGGATPPGKPSGGLTPRFRGQGGATHESKGALRKEASPRWPGVPQPASREEMMAIGKSELEPAFVPFAQRYAKVGYRDGFLWKWVQRGLDLTALPSIDHRYGGANRTAKLLGVMLDVLLDDVADNLKDGDFLGVLLKVPFHPGPQAPPGLGPDRIRYYQFTVEVWSEIARLARGFPRYDELAEVFEFDYLQLLNTMRYAFLVNRLPELLNPTEHDLYQPHNMHMMISGTLDLMCSPGFERKDLALIRQALWRGQVMGRIGNMVSTWEREIRERDFTSGVFSAAIERGLVMASDLALIPAEELRMAIEKSGVIEYFLRQWQRLRDEVFQIARRVESVDLSVLAAGLEELIRNHLGSRGLK